MRLQSQCFSKQQRLLSKLDYSAVFKDPVCVKSAFFTVLARSTDRLWGRLGLIVSKRAIKKAVDRNRIKRLIRESFRTNKGRFIGLDVIVLVRGNCNKRANHYVQDCLEKQWQALDRRYKNF